MYGNNEGWNIAIYSPDSIGNYWEIDSYDGNLRAYTYDKDGVFHCATIRRSDGYFVGNITGNSATATKLQTARTISLTGSVTGSGSFDGSGNLSITTSTNHTHNYLPLTGGTISGSLNNYIPLTGSTAITGKLKTTGEIVSTNDNAFRSIYGDYGFFIRNDGSNVYFMLTNAGEAEGAWNDLRPLLINNATGKVLINGINIEDVSATANSAYGTANSLNGKIAGYGPSGDTIRDKITNATNNVFYKWAAWNPTEYLPSIAPSDHGMYWYFEIHKVNASTIGYTYVVAHDITKGARYMYDYPNDTWHKQLSSECFSLSGATLYITT